MDNQSKLQGIIASFPTIFNRINERTAINHLKCYERKGVMYFESFYPVCPHCFGRYYESRGFATRKVKLLEKGTVEVKVKQYKCKHCNKYFRTDISFLVDSYKNISKGVENEVIELSKFTNDYVMITKSLKRKFNVEISKTAVENIVDNFLQNS